MDMCGKFDKIYSITKFQMYIFSYNLLTDLKFLLHVQLTNVYLLQSLKMYNEAKIHYKMSYY